MVNLKRKKFCQISRIFFKLQFRASNYRTRDIISRSWWEAIHKDSIFWKNLLINKEMVFGNGVKKYTSHNLQWRRYSRSWQFLKKLYFLKLDMTRKLFFKRLSSHLPQENCRSTKTREPSSPSRRSYRLMKLSSFVVCRFFSQCCPVQCSARHTYSKFI